MTRDQARAMAEAAPVVYAVRVEPTRNTADHRLSDSRRSWMTGPSVWRVLLLAAVLVVLAVGDVPERTRFWEAAFDAGHVPLFGVFALVLRSLLAGRQAQAGPPWMSFKALGLTLVVAAASEILQLLQPNRDASQDDFLRDAAGAAAFLLFRAAFVTVDPASATPRRRTSRVVAAVTAVALLVAAGADLIVTAALYIARDRAFPTLFALDGSWWERMLIEAGANTLSPGQAPAGLAQGTTPRLARVDLRPGLYSGLSFDEPYPDWRGYSRLVFEVVSDLNAPLVLVIRVHDAAHDQRYADRFNRRLTVDPGVNRVVIPVADIRRAPDRREMNLGKIRGIVLFAYRLEQPTHVYLGPLRLE